MPGGAGVGLPEGGSGGAGVDVGTLPCGGGSCASTPVGSSDQARVDRSRPSSAVEAIKPSARRRPRLRSLGAVIGCEDFPLGDSIRPAMMTTTFQVGGPRRLLPVCHKLGLGHGPVYTSRAPR